MTNGRTAALKTLNRCFGKGGWSSQVISSEISSLDRREAALATRLALGVMQNSMLLDFYIDSYASRPGRLELPVRNILRIGAYQILLSSRIPVSAAVNSSVELCRGEKLASASGLVNAVLRKIASASETGSLPEIPCTGAERLSILYSHPLWFVRRLSESFGEAFAEAFLRADNEETPAEDRAAFAEGETYVQDGAAYASVLMAQPKPGMKVLDACSAPGGKSFTCAVLMNNEGSITSCDIHEKKLRLVEEGASRLGIGIIRTRAADASEFIPEFESAFDLVIADVPCSGFGVIRKKPEIRFKSEEEIRDLPQIQERILANLSRYVTPGGTILYSTCTVFPEENSGVVNGFLSGNTVFELVTEKTFYPNIDGTDGFYAAVLKRNV